MNGIQDRNGFIAKDLASGCVFWTYMDVGLTWLQADVLGLL